MAGMSTFYATFFLIVQGVPVIIESDRVTDTFASMDECSVYISQELVTVFDIFDRMGGIENAATGVCLPIDFHDKRDI